jgi:hypothetical protein
MEFYIYTLDNIYYICFLLFIGIFYNYKTVSIKIIIKHYLYFIYFHILFNLYKYMEIIIKYIMYNTMIGISIIIIFMAIQNSLNFEYSHKHDFTKSVSFSITFTLRK